MASAHHYDGENEDLVLTEQGGKCFYNRSTAPPVDDLCAALQRCYACAHALVFPSGMCAISSLLQSLLQQGPPVAKGAPPGRFRHVICGTELYCDTPRLLRALAEQYGLVVHEVDVRAAGAVVECARGIGPAPKLAFFESCTNPSGHLLAPGALAGLRALGVTVVLDHTWLTHLAWNPLAGEPRADFVVCSLTKYYSAGHAIAGAVLGHDGPAMRALHQYRCRHGLHVSPFNAAIVLRNMADMESRLARSSALTLRVVDALVAAGHRVSHPHVARAGAELLTGPLPSVFTVDVPLPKAKVMPLLEANPHLEHKTSFGAELSRTDPWPKSHAVTAGKVTVPSTAVRVSIGYADDFDRILAGVAYIFKDCAPAPP